MSEHGFWCQRLDRDHDGSEPCSPFPYPEWGSGDPELPEPEQEEGR